MVGVLGIAGMQLMAINNTETARYKNAATTLASSIAAKIQANTGYWGSPPTAVIVAGSSVTNGPPDYSSDCYFSNANQCAASDMASFDLKQWGADMQALPSGQGSIRCPAGPVPAVCTIAITWNEKNIALNAATGTESGVLATGTVQGNEYKTMVSIPK